ncbi:hypothetical protein F2P81_000196 [Scophthalmus maximus]|uniref:Uncharacterized protein n=1 Tax=Scophthalmus maximus TaxID=52904 RepID=A0A6A4TKH7_SCOMX|nr:hypothetical protein F2P81_000196 [Scophthalmus maximus]
MGNDRRATAAAATSRSQTHEIIISNLFELYQHLRLPCSIIAYMMNPKRAPLTPSKCPSVPPPDCRVARGGISSPPAAADAAEWENPDKALSRAYSCQNLRDWSWKQQLEPHRPPSDEGTLRWRFGQSDCLLHPLCNLVTQWKSTWLKRASANCNKNNNNKKRPCDSEQRRRPARKHTAGSRVPSSPPGRDELERLFSPGNIHHIDVPVWILSSVSLTHRGD